MIYKSYNLSKIYGFKPCYPSRKKTRHRQPPNPSKHGYYTFVPTINQAGGRRGGNK